SYISRSTDGGKSWSQPEDITSIIYGPEADNPQCRKYRSSFFGSGNGITLRHGEHAGRIMFVAAMYPAQYLNNHAVYSDDGGKTWHVSDIAFEGGDEAKVVELSDGRILMSIRRSGERGYSISCDGGETWSGQGLWPEINTNACNGDMIRYSSTDDGKGYNLLLHSIPNDRERRNVSIFRSYDEGQSWVSPKTICPGNSVYSSLTVLNDGTIGIYVEENPGEEGCSLWFMNFSLDWLTRP
ncbi:MAG: glycoside hydrolase, partial [Bacteroidales bacterium]|nr:glycoside hydrolase [Bacteroidales bacterium]